MTNDTLTIFFSLNNSVNSLVQNEDNAKEDAENPDDEKKEPEPLKVILPPQNPVGPGEMGEAVEIKDPDPETKLKIGNRDIFSNQNFLP